MLMEQSLHEMRLSTNFGSNEPRHAGWPIQKRVTHGTGNLVGPRVRNADINEPATGPIQREALCLNLQCQPGHSEPAKGRRIRPLRERGGAGQDRGGHIPPNPLEVPRPVLLAHDPSAALRLLDSCVGDPKAACNLAARHHSLRH